jgi:hypothetical protein
MTTVSYGKLQIGNWSNRETAYQIFDPVGKTERSFSGVRTR